jgi:hypothetical protein
MCSVFDTACWPELDVEGQEFPEHYAVPYPAMKRSLHHPSERERTSWNENTKLMTE